MSAMPRLTTVLSIGSLLLSLTVVALSSASLYLTSNAMRLMDTSYPAGSYQWYRDFSWAPNVKPSILLHYEDKNEATILASSALSCLVGIAGVVIYFVTRNATKPTQRSTISLFILPVIITFLATLVAIIYTSVMNATSHSGQCYVELGGYPNNYLKCTRELATCTIFTYISGIRWQTSHQVCRESQNGRHLLVPLCVMSALMAVVGVAKLIVVRKGRNEYVETADDRVAKLQSTWAGPRY